MASPVSTQVTHLSRAAVEELSRRKQEPEWLREQRLAAWDNAQELPMPVWRRSKWWTTDLTGLDVTRIEPLTDEGKTNALPKQFADHTEPRAESAGTLVQYNNHVIHTTLQESLEQQGVLLMDLDEAIRDYPDLVRPNFMTKAVPARQEDKIIALHSAFHSSGTFLYIPKNVQVTLPIQLFYDLDRAGIAHFTHTLVVAEPFSKVIVVEEYQSTEHTAQTFHSGVVEIVAGDGANVEFCSIQNWAKNVYSVENKRAYCSRDAHVLWTIATMGSKLNRLSLETELPEAGGSTEMLGLFFADQDQHLDVFSRALHMGGHTSSDALYKGALTDNAETSYEGIIRVVPEAQQINAYLASHTLLLSEKAKSDSLPTLAVEANDVRAAHGATVGMIDKEQLFYLQCRGIDLPTATRMIVEGFFEPVVQRVPLESVRTRLRESLTRKIHV